MARSSQPFCEQQSTRLAFLFTARIPSSNQSIVGHGRIGGQYYRYCIRLLEG